MSDFEEKIAAYMARFKVPQTSNLKILAAFKIASRSIALKALSASSKGDYLGYFDRITSVVDTLLGFQNLPDAEVERLAVMVYVGTALDYKKSNPLEVEEAIKQFGLKNPHTVKMYDWALNADALFGLNDELKIITTAWLLSDGEKQTDHLTDLPDQLKLSMKTVHGVNYRNAEDIKLPNTVRQRLTPALQRLLAL